MLARNARVAALIIPAVALAVVWSCSDENAQPSPASDASPADDARRPTSDAAEPGDAAIDADAAPGVDDPFTAGSWTHAPGVPPQCDVRIADHPETISNTWLDCPSKRPGCRVLDTSWTSRPLGEVLWASKQNDPARLVNGKPLLLIERQYPVAAWWTGSFDADVQVIAPPDGPAVAAIGEAVQVVNGKRIRCTTNVHFGEYGVSYNIVPPDPANPSVLQPTNVFGWAPWSTPTSFSYKVMTTPDFGLPDGSLLHEGALGATGVWLGTITPKSVAEFDIATQTGKAFLGARHFEAPITVPGGAVAFDIASPFSIVFLAENGSVNQLVTPTAPQFVTWVAVERSNGTQLVWVESEYGGLGYTNDTLWTAPVATSEAQLVRRKVAKLDDPLGRGGGYGVANAGVFLTLIGENRALLTRLSDGAGWTIDGEPGSALTSPVWVDDQDVFFETRWVDPTLNRPQGLNEILRISRATLGAPTVDAGL